MNLSKYIGIGKRGKVSTKTRNRGEINKGDA